MRAVLVGVVVALLAGSAAANGRDPGTSSICFHCEPQKELENATSGDSIYRSVDAGSSWTKIVSKSAADGYGIIANVR